MTRRTPHLAVISILAIQAAVYLAMAWHKPLWFDEMFTVHIGRFSSWREFLWLLRHAGDFSPPLTPLLTRGFDLAGGGRDIWIRLPFIMAFIGMHLAVYAYVRRRAGDATALLATVFSMSQFKYAAEARGYALVLAGTAAAFYFWSRTSESARRRRHVVAFGLSLCIAMASHFYALFLLLPFGVGELRRWVTRRRPDTAMISAMALSTLPILLSSNILTYARTFVRDYHDAVRPLSVFRGYAYLTYPPAVLAALGLLLLTLAIHVRKRRAAPVAETLNIPKHEAWALGGLAAIPLAGYMAAYAVTGVFTFRHYIAGAIALSVAGAWMAHRVLRGSARHLLILAAAAAVFTLQMEAGAIIRHRDARMEGRRMMDAIAGLPGQRPVAVQSPAVFVQLVHYLHPPLRDRVVFITGARPPLHPDAQGTSVRSLLDLASAKQWNVITHREFENRSPDGYHALESEGFGKGWRLRGPLVPKEETQP